MCKGTFGLKNVFFWENGHAKGLWSENGVLGKWACKGTFGVKMEFWGNGHAKRLLG